MMMKAVTESFRQSFPSGLDRSRYADSSISDCIQFWNITPASRTQRCTWMLERGWKSLQN